MNEFQTPAAESDSTSSSGSRRHDCWCGLPPVRSEVRPQLGEREREALLHWLRHDSKRAAAARMYVTESTLSTHIERIRRKYDALGRPAPTKAAMLVRALQDGLIDPADL